MNRRVKAIFESGVLRPLTPIRLPEHSEVMLDVSDEIESLLDQEYLEDCTNELASGEIPSLDEIRAILSKVSGSLVSDFIAERDER